MTDRSTSLSGKRNARAICWLCLAGLLLLPSWSAALGLGQLRVDSALNQRLDAEIELLSVQPGDLDSLEVRLATQSLEGNINARSVEFNYRIENRDGRIFIRLFSSRPIREPLLNFLVELNWQQGRLLRELAIFLDPPTSPPRTVAAAPPSPPRRTEPTAPPPTAPQFSTEEQAGALSYGPVRRGETLWAIASRARPGPEVSVPQMIQVIYEANPGAFARRSPDTLMAGVTLRIPAVAGQPPRQPEAPSASTPAPAVAARPEPAPEPAPEPPAVDTPVEPESTAEVRLLPPDEDLTEFVDDPVTREAPARSAVIASAAGRPSLRLAGFDELRARVRRLEQQGLLSARGQPVDEPPADAAETPDAATMQQPTEAIVQLETAQSEQAGEEATAATTAAVSGEATVGGSDATAVEEPAPAATVQSSESETAPSEPTEAVPVDEPVVLTEAPSAPQQGIDLVGLLIRLQSDPLATLSELRSRPLALPLLGVAVALLLLLALLLRRSRRRAEQRDEAELQQAFATPESTDAGTAEPTRLKSAPLRQRAGRIDRVDFLLAAGSYREAENLVRLALVDDPDNTDLRVKMLEIHHRAGNADRFVEAAEELHQRIPADSEQWQRVRAMGQTLVPGQPLFEPPISARPATRDSGVAATPPPRSAAPESEPPATSRQSDVIEFRGFETARPRPTMKPDEVEGGSTEPDAARPDAAETTRVVPPRAGPDGLLQRLDALRLADDPLAAGESSGQADRIGEPDEPYETGDIDDIDDEADRLASELDGKLIRAAACMERDDYDNARKLLDEVLLHGDLEHQAQARAMLSRMA